MSGRPFGACLVVLCLLLGVSTKAPAADTLRLYYLTLPGLLETLDNKPQGPLNNIVLEISFRSGVKFDMQYMVMNRMIRELQTDEVAAGVPQLGPMIKHRYEKPVQLSLPVIFRRDYAFVRENTTIPQTIDEIRSRVLVVSPMTTLPPPLREIMTELTIIETHSDASALTLLSKGRADVWVNDETTTRAGMLEAGVDNIKYDVDKPFYVWPAHIVYSRTVDKSLIKRIDRAIKSMVEDGTMQSILPHNFVGRYGAYLDTTNGN